MAFKYNIKMADKIYSLDNCKSRSEFVDRAIRFYCGYVETNIAQDYIADVFTQTVFPKLDNMKKVLNKSIYNMALQLSMLSHFEAALCDYEDDDLKKLREIFVFYLVVSKKVLSFAAQRKRQFIQLKIISPSGAPKGSILEGRYLF